MRTSPSGTFRQASHGSALAMNHPARNELMERGWNSGGPELIQVFNDTMIDPEANEVMATFVRRKIAEVVKDPQTADGLTLRDHPIGTKRICIDIDYFEAYNRDNVTLVDLKREPTIEITKGSVRTTAIDYTLDSLILATGFGAMTGSLLAINIHGRNGQALKDKWAAGPRTYLGIATAGFQNLFMVTGPGSPSVLSNVFTSIEQHVEWITGCLVFLCEKNLTSIEPLEEFEDEWVKHVNEVASATLSHCVNSWYLGATVPGKPRVFMPYVGGVGKYRERCEQIAAGGYGGFSLIPSAEPMDASEGRPRFVGGLAIGQPLVIRIIRVLNISRVKAARRIVFPV